MVHKALSLFLLAATALQAAAYPAADPKIQVGINGPLEADSLLNIHLEYPQKTMSEVITIAIGSCDGNTISHDIGSVQLTADYQPKKFIWYVPSELYGSENTCFQAWTKDADGKMQLAGQSEPQTVIRKISKRGHPEFEGMYFDAVSYHKSNFARRGTFAAKDKSDVSKYKQCAAKMFRYVCVLNFIFLPQRSVLLVLECLVFSVASCSIRLASTTTRSSRQTTDWAGK